MNYKVQDIKNYIIMLKMETDLSKGKLNENNIPFLLELKNDYENINIIKVLDDINELAGIRTEVEDDI